MKTCKGCNKELQDCCFPERGGKPLGKCFAYREHQKPPVAQPDPEPIAGWRQEALAGWVR